MTKRIVIFLISTIVMFFIGYFLNKYLLGINKQTLSFSLLSVYLFNTISCCLIYIAIETIANFLPNEAGYLYLGLSMVKLGVFILIFQEPMFSDVALTKAEKTSIVIPFLIFLLVEAIGVSKLLNNK